MNITFTRSGKRAYTTSALRDDGVLLRVPSFDRPAVLPHDLAHYIVERELGLRDGFWGRVAAGAVFPGMEVVSGRQPPHAAERSRAILREAGQHGTEAEVLVGILVDIVQAGLDTNTSAVQARLSAAWRPSRPSREPVSLAEARRACAALRQAQERWLDLPIGQAITCVWPSPGRGKR